MGIAVQDLSGIQIHGTSVQTVKDSICLKLSSHCDQWNLLHYKLYVE